MRDFRECIFCPDMEWEREETKRSSEAKVIEAVLQDITTALNSGDISTLKKYSTLSNKINYAIEITSKLNREKSIFESSLNSLKDCCCTLNEMKDSNIVALQAIKKKQIKILILLILIMLLILVWS